MKPTALLAIALTGVLLFSGCRGQISRQPPMWIMHGMEFQPRYNAYEGNTFFEDGRNMRTPPEGTVARGLLKEDDAFYRGGDTLNPVRVNPMPVTLELLERGQARYDIYCTPCHAATGIGNGIVIKRGFIPPPSLHDARIVGLADGQIFQVISRGLRNMPGYATQIPESDRWAITAYVRALQLSQRASTSDVPEGEKAN